MSTPVLNNGLLLRDTSYKMQPHIDSYHLLQQIQGTEPTNLGPVELWAQARAVQAPLYQLSSFDTKNIITVDDVKGRYKWQLPVKTDLPISTGDLDPSNTTKGIDGQFFRIKLSRRAFGNGAIITYDKFSGPQLLVSDDPIIQAGDDWIFTVSIINNDNVRFLSNEFLAPGIKWFAIGSAKGEHGVKYDDIGESNAGLRDYYNFVGGATAHAHYSVSSKAKMIADGYLNSNGTVPVTEIWKSYDKNLDPSIASFDDLYKLLGKSGMEKAMSNGGLRRSFVTKLDGATLSKVARDVESYMMWGSGGRAKTGGPEELRLSVGLWRQLDYSFRRIYNKATFTLDFFESEIFNFFNGKVSFDGPESNRKLIIQTGMAGMRLVNRAIAAKVGMSGMVTNSTDVGAVTGKAMDLAFGFAYTTYNIPFLANCKFVINPALDNIDTNTVENPLIDGYPLSSYSFIMFDITDNKQDNIKMLKYGPDSQLRWWYDNGSLDYMGRQSGFQGHAKFSGFKVYMEQTMPALHVVDPTKILKIVMRNPITGGHL